MENQSKDWIWVTHFLAIFFSVVCLGLVVYTVVWVDDIDVAKMSIGFSGSIFGVILGFYFNRERLTKESRQKDYFSTNYSDLLSTNAELTAAYGALLDRVARTVEGTEEEE
jgi:hypothetical protein